MTSRALLLILLEVRPSYSFHHQITVGYLKEYTADADDKLLLINFDGKTNIYLIILNVMLP